MADGGNMVNQPQLLKAVKLGSWCGADVEVGEGEQASPSPLVEGILNFRVPHQIRRAVGPGLLNRKVVVRAADFVLGAILALGKALITPDVSLLACLATLAGLGVAMGKGSAPSPGIRTATQLKNIPSPRWTAARTSHCGKFWGVSDKKRVTVVASVFGVTWTECCRVV